MPQMSQVLSEHAIGKLSAAMVTIAVARKLNVNFSIISHLKRCFREFGSTSNWPHNHRPRIWHRVDERFSDVNVVNRVPHDGGGVGMLWINMYDSVFQFPPISSNFTQLLQRSGTTFHRPQSTACSTLCEGYVSHIWVTDFPIMWNPYLLSTFILAHVMPISATHMALSYWA